MPQPIEEGMVLGGRYLVTGHVLTSADQDMVLDGRDQVLNRDVSILVASSDHASQVAASARELATGERQGTIQVLDLGLSEGRTYLIAGGNPAPEDLLDMTREQQVYVEPFYTDTLGSEIFGEARTYEPQVYEDDEEYYEELDDGYAGPETETRRPKFLRGISDRLSQRLGSDDAAKDAVDGRAAAGAAGAGAAGATAARNPRRHDDGARDEHDPYRSAVLRTDDTPLPETVSDADWTGAQDEVTATSSPADRNAAATSASPVVGIPSDDGREGSTRDASDHGRSEDTGEETGETPTAAVASPAIGRHSPKPGREPDQRAAERPKVTLWDDTPYESTRDDHAGAAGESHTEDRRSAGALGAGVVGAGLAAGAGSGSAGAGGPRGGSAGGSSRHPDADHGGDDDYPGFEDYEEHDEDDKPRGARWLVGGILVLLLILGAVFAFNILDNNRNPEAGGGESTTPGSSPTESSQGQTRESQLPEPAIVSATRVVPDDDGLSAETDSTLPNAIDGNPATAWQTYTFAQPAFGGYASSMALVIELEELSAVSQVDIIQNNGSGGSFSVLLSDTPEIDDARQIAEGSLTGPEVSVPIPDEGGAPAEAQYVIINFTELPELSNATSNRPYGLRIAEVEVN
ncbi:hypothetical protein [Citricoccus sp. K5]|uniref:hypothetical protein n=1 Tax=Citricoccus sp. K5 TaxID=2653135 RepID=UPI0012F231A2|nr:hypothetical protein [Citricoccus sp. K5]VXB98235.1 conserved hypothetical protein [Citricoccus sp. K5]